jgi:hypothetical protein
MEIVILELIREPFLSKGDDGLWWQKVKYMEVLGECREDITYLGFPCKKSIAKVGTRIKI